MASVTIDFTSYPLVITSSGTFTLNRVDLNFTSTPLIINTSGTFDILSGAVGAIGIPLWTVSGLGEAPRAYGIISIPQWTLDGSGLVTLTGTGDIQIPVLTVLGDGDIIGLGTGNILIPVWTIVGQGHTGILGIGNVNVNLWTVKGYAHISPTALGDIDIPLWIVQGAGSQSTVTLIYRGMAMNVTNFAVTEYSDFPFNSFCYFNGKYYGASPSGIFLLEGNDDNGTRIASQVISGPQDMYARGFIRRLREAWLAYREGNGELMLWLIRGEKDHWEKLFETVSGKAGLLHERRAKIAHGIKDRFIAFGFKNVSGNDFDVESLRIIGEEIRQRAR